MKTPEWLKPGIYGGVVGAAAAAIIGFSWGGWVTSSKAADMAQIEVVAALVPICIAQSSQDPQSVEALAQLRDARSYQRNDLVMKAGWATMPGSDEPNRQVARACVAQLAAQF